MISNLNFNKWRNLSVNIFSLTGVHLANNLLPFFTVPIVVRIIGPEKLGLLNFSMTFIQYFLLFISFGFDLTVVRKISINRHNKEYINSTFNTIIFARLILLLISFIAFLTIVYSFESLRENSFLHFSTFLCCIGVAFFPSWLYQGMEDLKFIAVVNFLVKISYVLLILIFLKTKSDFVYQNLFIGITHAVGGILAYIIAINRYNLKFKLVKYRDVLLSFKEASTLFLSNLATNIYSYCHPLIIGIFCNIESVGIFSAASRLEIILNAFMIMAFNQALFPIIASRFGESLNNGLDFINKVLPIYLLTSLFVVFSIEITAPFIISIIYGNKFQESILILRIIGLLPITSCLTTLLGVHLMLNLKLDRQYLNINSCCYIIGIMCSYYFIYKFNYIGAAIAWVITEVLLVIVMLWYLKKFHSYIIDSILNPNFWHTRLTTAGKYLSGK
ncbi:oligosaccharide flippase family protein [Fibrella arboris]|uniref:oligosaccharide flippase family protein n=1 Tax=Fibrella arboris TaxID=3242486 RepID=UPI003521B131